MAATRTRTDARAGSRPPNSTFPDELEAEVREAGFQVEALVGVEGPGRWVTDIDEWLDEPSRREVLLRAIRRVEAQRSLLGASPHVLAVGRKPLPD